MSPRSSCRHLTKDRLVQGTIRQRRRLMYKWSKCASAIEERVKSSGDGYISGQEEEKTTYKANDDYKMSRCDMMLDDGGAGTPGTLGII
uniref:Uncharacterized protein n=1 Tax=Hyaloperonospora arabidopsidis (strain Emoy2) TaxID=559515 RepID=M4BAG6_HYAAE